MLTSLKKMWGSNQSKGFKVASWGAAVVIFGCWYTYENYNFRNGSGGFVRKYPGSKSIEDKDKVDGGKEK